MSFDNVQKILDYGSTYRVQEMEDMINDTAAGTLADSICTIMITVKSTMPVSVWNQMVKNLLRFQTDVQFQLIREGEEDED